VSDVDITIGAQDKASSVINGVAGKVGGFGASLGALGPVALGIGAVLGGVTIAVKGLTSAFDALAASAASIDEVAKSATSLGSSVSDLQSIELVLRQMTGIDAAGTTQALKEMQKRIGELASGAGSEEQRTILERLGLDAATLSTQSPLEQFTQLQSAISNVENAAERAAIADKLFGGDGAKLLPAFAADADSFAEAIGRAGASALTLSDAQAKGVEAMNDALDNATSSFSALVNQVMAELAPVIESIANQINEWLPPIVEIASMILPSLIDAMINVAGYASEIAIAFGQLSAFDFSGAIGTMENLGSTSEKWLANVEEARKRSREAAENAASDQEAARATPPVDQRAIADQQAKQEAAEKTIAQLERQLAVTIQGEDAIRRQEELAMATNDVERERIAILQQQITAQEKQKELIEAQKRAEEEAAKDRQKMLEEQAKERDRIQGAISAFDPGVQAVQGRLLTRGDSDRSPEKIVKNTERAAGLLEAIQGLLERPPASSDQIVFEGVGA
jgi:hypothetical protein